jgi:excisionase family DNA binding protein
VSELKDPLLTREEARAQLKIAVSTLDVAIRQGMIKVRRIGVRVLIPQSELDRFVRRDVHHIWPQKKDGKTVRSPLGAVVSFREAVNA